MNRAVAKGSRLALATARFIVRFISREAASSGLYPEKLLLLGLELLLAYDPLVTKLGQPLQLGHVIRLGGGGRGGRRRGLGRLLLLAIEVLAHPHLALHPRAPPLHTRRGPVSLPRPHPVRGPLCKEPHFWRPPSYRSFSNPFWAACT